VFVVEPDGRIVFSKKKGNTMQEKIHSHRVMLNDQRRDNKKATDAFAEARQSAMVNVFNMYYRDQVKELYKMIARER